MIRNTCLTGGSLGADAAGGVPASLDGALACGAAGLVEGGADGAAPVGAAAAGEGVGSGADEGASLAAEPREDSAPDELGAVGAGACWGGRITFTPRPAEAASVSGARELAAAPSATPKPRNATTSTAEIRAEGSVSATLGRLARAS